MPERKESSITFKVEESIWFERGQEVDELISISLSPHIELLNEEDYVVLKGTLELSGEYKHVNEENEVEFPIMGRQYIQSIEIRNETESEFFHQLPLDITIPKRKVNRLEDIAVDIESFDYNLTDKCCLQLLADIEIRGVYEEEEFLVGNMEEDLDGMNAHTYESSSRVESTAGLHDERLEEISEITSEITDAGTEENRLEDQEKHEFFAEVQAEQQDISVEAREEEQQVIELKTREEEHQAVQLESREKEQQAIEVESQEKEQQTIELEVREKEQQTIELESREKEQQAIEVESQEKEQQTIELEVREKDQQAIELESREKEQQVIELEVQEKEQQSIELEVREEEQLILVESQEEELQPILEEAREEEQQEIRLAAQKEELDIHVEAQEQDESFYDLFKIEANIIPEKREITDVQPTLDYRLPKLPEISIESLERRGRDHMQIESSSHYIESSSHIHHMKDDEVESSSHVHEEKKQGKKKKDKYKSMSFADFFARKDEGAAAKLKMCLVQHGDSIQELADKYKVTVQQILRANQLEANHEVYEGQVLYIPVKVNTIKTI